MNKNITWIEYQRMLIPKNPPHEQMNISVAEGKQRLKKSNAFMVRWVTHFNQNNKSQFWVIINDNYQGLNSLKKSTRSEIKRGMKNTTVKQSSLNWLLKYGYDIYKSASSKYGMTGALLSQIAYQKKMEDILSNEPWDIWIVESKKLKTPAGYALVKKGEDSVELSVVKLNPEFLIERSSYHLIYRILEDYIIGRNMNYISGGMKSLYHQTNFQTYLINKFNFKKAYCRLNLYYKFYVKYCILILFLLQKYKLLPMENRFPKLMALIKQEKIRRSFD